MIRDKISQTVPKDERKALMANPRAFPYRLNPRGLLLLDDDGTRQDVVVEEESVNTAECLLLESARINTGLDESVVNSLSTLLRKPLVGPDTAGLLVCIAVDNIYAVVLGVVDSLSIELDTSLVLAGEVRLADLEEDCGR